MDLPISIPRVSNTGALLQLAHLLDKEEVVGGEKENK